MLIYINLFSCSQNVVWLRFEEYNSDYYYQNMHLYSENPLVVTLPEKPPHTWMMVQAIKAHKSFVYLSACLPVYICLFINAFTCLD